MRSSLSRPLSLSSSYLTLEPKGISMMAVEFLGDVFAGGDVVPGMNHLKYCHRTAVNGDNFTAYRGFRGKL